MADFKTCTHTEYEGERGNWERLTIKTVSVSKSLRERMVNTSQGKASAKRKEASCWSFCPWQSGNDGLVHSHGESAPWAVFFFFFFSFQPADFNCSCYSTYFWKYEDLWKIIEPRMNTTASTREKATMREMYVGREKGLGCGSSAGIMLVRFSM